MSDWLKSAWKYLSLQVIGRVQWNDLRARFNGGVYWDLTVAEQAKIRELLAIGYYVILTRRKTHLTTYLIAIGTWIKTGSLGYWAHGLMNLEEDVESDADFRLMEATGLGVHYSPFDQVFDCDSAALLRPKGFSIEDWARTLDKLKMQLGKPYDTLYDISRDSALSCVELIRLALQASENYAQNFKRFEALVNKGKIVTPQMLYDCGEFEIVYEVRH